MLTNPKDRTTEAPWNNLSCFHPVPLCYQETIYTCGVACVQSLLADYGIVYRQDTLIELLKQKPILGTYCEEILHFMKMLGFLASLKNDMNLPQLKNFINKGIAPLLLIQAWKEDAIDYSYCWRDSHYVIACGYDENRIIFMDPYTLGAYTYIPNSELLKRWHHLDTKGNQCYQTALIIENEHLSITYQPNILMPLK